MEATNVAKTILEQIGHKAFYMLGGKDALTVTGGEGSIYPSIVGGLQFKIRGSKKVNTIRVLLTYADTYTVEFWKIGGAKVQKVAEVDDVYVDALRTVIEKHTGLYTSL